MAYLQTAPIFADRYRFEPVPKGWDTGRTGFTYLVYDLEKKRPGVIKRADVSSKHSVAHLRNEISALRALKGSNVPEVYEDGQVIYDSKKYEYIVVEYINCLRIEEDLGSLSTLERIEILSQFFSLLDRSHGLGIVNGDVDLKHLFWDGNKKKLVVIDWGNAKLVEDPRKKTEFSYDLARSAEIIYSLVTLKGHPPSTGSLALPNDALIYPALLPIPEEFKKLCKWAPRTPVEGIQSPYTAKELREAAIQWKTIRQDKKQLIEHRRQNGKIIPRLLFVSLLLLFFVFLWIVPSSPIYDLIHKETSTPVATLSETPADLKTDTSEPSPIFSETPTATEVVTDTPTPTFSPTYTPTPGITPLARNNSLVEPVFDQLLLPSECWSDKTNSETDLLPLEGFSKRDDGNWRFNFQQDIGKGYFLQTDFSQCFSGRQVNAFAANIWVDALEMQRSVPDAVSDNTGRGIGFFIVGSNGVRREYTIWVNETSSVHWAVREDGTLIIDNTILLINPKNLKITDEFPRLYARFPIQIFLEINNQGLDILYLKEGPGQKVVTSQALDSQQMGRVDGATLETLGEIKSFGLIGYGGEIRTIVWPIVFFGK